MARTVLRTAAMIGSGRKRGFSLRSALWQAGDNIAKGAYAPATGVRTVNLGANHASPVARMVSIHETFHSLLNASTTFGVAMVLAGALHQAGDPGLDALIEQMIESSVETHETYATMSGIYATAHSAYDRSLLESYPDYQVYFDRMAAALDLANAPFFSWLCIAAAARVAMQTNILDRWICIPCSEWSATSWEEADAPDVRFALVTRPDALAAAKDALGKAIAGTSPATQVLARAGLSREDRIRAVVGAPLAEQEALQGVAFQAIAEACFPAGPRRPRWGAQRQAAALASDKLKTYAGPRLRTRLLSSENFDSDCDGLLVESQRERLVIWPSKIPAALSHIRDQSGVDPSSFVLHRPGFRPHLQLVGLPCDKLPALYDLKGSLANHPSRQACAVLRRFVYTPALPIRGFVHMLQLDSIDDLPDPPEDGVPPHLFGLVCASALADENWSEKWMSALYERGADIAMLIDVDPFGLLPAMAQRIRLNLVRTILEPGELDLPANVHIIGFVSPDLPNFLLFSPCSEALAMSFAMMVERGSYNIGLDGSLTDAQRGLLQMAISHILVEEPQFGFGEWWRHDEIAL